MAELTLTEDPDDKRRWTLEGVGELRWEKGMFKNGEATLTADGTTWSLENATFSSKATAVDAAGTEVASYEPKSAFKRGGELVVGDRAWALKPAARFKNRYALVDGDTELATIETEGWAQRRVVVELEDPASVPGEVLLMACWRVRGFAEESAGATASVSGSV